MRLRTAMKVFVPAVVAVTLVLLLLGIPGKYFVQKHPLECECGKCSIINKDLKRTLDNIEKNARLEIDKKNVDDIAVYFRDLKTGAWFSINKDEKFNLASLIKVPLMMECLESVESHPDMLKKRLFFAGNKDWTSQQNIKPVKTLEPGRTYSLDEIMFRMIAYSDNNAMSLLLNEFPGEGLYQYLAEHHMDYEKAPDGLNMSLGTYSRLFEALYNKSLLSSAMSQKALSYLAAEDFPQGMHAGVPANVVVESKFGEKVLLNENGKEISRQLHEVGIILNGDHPFLLGIMTSGKDFFVLEKVIRTITHDVYEEFNHFAILLPNKNDCLHSRCHS